MPFISALQQKRAIAYYRHSDREKQENSIPIQRELIHKFAKEHKIEIIHEESDKGTGLDSNRPGFQRLLSQFGNNPNAPAFDYVFVLDVTRWGRWLNFNKPGHYELLFQDQGKQVVYVTRGFPQPGHELEEAIMTSVERMQAANFIRELSRKVFYGSVKVSEQGYSAGGTACYGMARILLDESRKPVQSLKYGEHKMISNQRVTFAPLNDDTTAVVKKIFDLLVSGWNSPKEIAEELNARGILSAAGYRWDSGKVIKILSNEIYCGTRVYNKRWGRLKQKSHANPRHEWVIRPDSFPAVVTKETFKRAQDYLYWHLPGRWKRGLYMIKRSRKIVLDDTITLLTKNNITGDQAEEILKEFPIIFSVSFLKDSKQHWCFIGPERIHNYDNAICVGITLDQRDPIDKVFKIPTENFKLGNFLVFSEDDSLFKEYWIPGNRVEEAMTPTINAVREFIEN